jgi:tetratricopeptide (TPR) repeat protein
MILYGCSVEKNTGSTRFYHGLTSRYNIYFNGNESFKKGAEKVSLYYKDDYSEILKMFEYSDPNTPSACSADMERAIQKASKVISLKSITTKPKTKGNSIPNEKEDEFLNRKEYNEWVDDCYLLMGKARLYTHDFEQAVSTLNYNIGLTVDNRMKNESTIWLAKVYNETGNYNESLRILSELNLSKDFSAEMLELYFTAKADLFLKQKRYEEALPEVEKALVYVSGKRNRYRLSYLAAQLYEKTGNSKMATTMYEKVVKLNPPYEVEFNARINLAGVFDVNTGNPASVTRELEKMLRNSKNKEFRDQIYFALGNLAQREGKEAEAIEYFKRSAAAGKQNLNQKEKTYLAIAKYYYKKQDYLNSAKYYDSTVFSLDQKNPDYQSIKNRSQDLSALVQQLNIIQREDSLQKVAKMPESQKNALIASIIEKTRKEESEPRQARDNSDRNYLSQYYENQQRFEGNINQEGKWYFYNQSALTFGRTEFRRRWGDRKLEDNWRRSNRSRTSVTQPTTNPEENKAAIKDTAAKASDNKNPSYYLKDLPVTDSLVKISNGKIADAYLESGKIYADRIQDKPNALGSFETLIKRFPDSMLEPEALYNIFRLYTEENNTKAGTYRQRLLEKYPDNEFTRIISDPDYYKKKMEELKITEKIYQEAYNLYSTDNFVGAIHACDSALRIYPRHELAPKFYLLRSYSIARTSDERTFKEELGKLIIQWPSSKEAEKANELVAFLNKQVPELKVEEDKQIAAEIYVNDTISMHVFALVIMDASFNINQATFDVISYNIDNYTNKNYRTEGLLVDNKYIMIKVSGFPDNKTVMEYYSNFNVAKIVRNPSGVKMISFIIGKQNLETLDKDKNPERYRLFFNAVYLKETNNN